MIESLDPILVSLGEGVDRARQRQQASLCKHLEVLLKELNPSLADIKLSYEKGWKGNDLSAALSQSLTQDIERGATGPGPHRADLLIYMNRKLARDRISRGEQKILSAAMLLSQAALMEDSGSEPMLLMDDLASEFDEQHLGRVLKVAERMNGQVWITGTSLEPYSDKDDGSYGMFHVEHGLITT